MDKSLFIKQLLKKETFSKDQKERFLKLVANEYSSNQIEYEELLKQLKNIKDKYNEIPSHLIDDLTNRPRDQINILKGDNNNLPEYIDPINLSSFLYDFNQNPILKTTCHLIDSNELISILKYTNKNSYNFKAHKQAIKHEYFTLLDKYKGKTSKNITGLIGEYLNGFKNKGWTTDKIMLNWSSFEVENWSLDNPGSPPNPDNTFANPEEIPVLPFSFRPIELKSGHSLNNFSDVVLHFKKQIQFRQGHSIRDIVNEVNFQYRDLANFNTENIVGNIQLFTDTGKVKQIYNAIIKMSINYFKEVNKESEPIFNLSFTGDGDKIILSIHNINSQFGKSIKDTQRYGQEFTNMINRQINGVCDFLIKADFKGKFAEISIWPPRDPILLDDFSGVEFKLIFYRAQ